MIFRFSDFGDSQSTLLEYMSCVRVADFEPRPVVDGDHMQAAAEVILKQIRILADQPTAARSFLVVDVYGRGVHTPSGESFRETLFLGLKGFVRGVGVSAPLNVAFADFSRIWDGVLGSYPGYEAFGYTSPDWCAPCNEYGCTTVGMCGDPEHYFYWLPGYVTSRSLIGDTDFAVWTQASIQRDNANHGRLRTASPGRMPSTIKSIGIFCATRYNIERQADRE